MRNNLGEEMRALSKRPDEDPFLAAVFANLAWRLTGKPGE
jgi:hypothetical protein